jgi:hypothetical protein
MPGDTYPGEGPNRQLFTHGTSGDPHSVVDTYAIGGVGSAVRGCSSPQCAEERESLRAELAERVKELREQKAQHDRLYLHKNEECARFAQTVVSGPLTLLQLCACGPTTSRDCPLPYPTS